MKYLPSSVETKQWRVEALSFERKVKYELLINRTHPGYYHSPLTSTAVPLFVLTRQNKYTVRVASFFVKIKYFLHFSRDIRPNA